MHVLFQILTSLSLLFNPMKVFWLQLSWQQWAHFTIFFFPRRVSLLVPMIQLHSLFSSPVICYHFWGPAIHFPWESRAFPCDHFCRAGQPVKARSFWLLVHLIHWNEAAQHNAKIWDPSVEPQVSRHCISERNVSRFLLKVRSYGITAWLISVSIMLSSSIHSVAKGRSSFFLSSA